MNPSNRDSGWPPSSGHPPGMQRGNDQSPVRAPGQPAQPFSSGSSQHQQGPPGAPVLPPPPGPFYPASGPSGPGTSLPSISGMTHGSPSHRPSLPQDLSLSSQQQQQGVHHQTLPGLYDRDAMEYREREMRERERDYEAQARRDQQQRDAQDARDARERDARERHQREQAPSHQSHTEQIPLHQPVAVGPQVRSAIHGPNGLLANAAPQASANQANSPAGGTHVPLFGPHMNEDTSRQQQGQIPQGTVPFGTPQMQQAPGQQPILNDALSYLDQVKVQFSGRPNVYNQFLDIMKDFKSQAIDTPGVIRRVSSLFAGNPNLIQGFNTFLPPGYRIECGTDGDPNGIRVTTPQGTQVSPMGTTLEPLTNPRAPPNEMSGGMALFNPGSGDAESWQDGRDRGTEQHEGIVTPGARGPDSRFGRGRISPPDGSGQRDHNIGINESLLAHQQEQKGVSQLQSAVSAAAGEQVSRHGAVRSVSPSTRSAAINDGQSGAQGPPALERKGPVEFNHAISYVNKIKNRFAQQPEIYKQFLEILQTYQRESKPIQDVYAQVTHLFNDAPDLLQDFKQFLPESAAHAKAAAARQAAEDMTTLSAMRGGPEYGAQGPSRHTPRPEQHRLPPVGNFAPTPTAGRDAKRKRGDKQGPIGSAIAPGTGHEFGAPVGSRVNFGGSKRVKLSANQMHSRPQPQADAPAVSPTLVPALPEPMPSQATSSATVEELNFFERAKKAIGNKNAMNEFLKLCNLFSQDLIDKNVLVYRAQSFIGENQELYSWFKTFVNYETKEPPIDNRHKTETGRVSLNNCRGYGPSYRLLPKHERLAVCSGRDELCNLVLNDDWASHPTWASEDSNFVVHRKNGHEEGLHRVEEERHDYDHHIAIGERAIQILEPLAQQIALFSTDQERVNWKLPSDLGGQSQSIFTRILAKIYGRGEGLRVLQTLPDRPASIVPIFLMRCRQKVEEWKLSQREWEKVWREQTQKMFWRSLDHQGISVKLTDKRQFQTKTLQTEMQIKYEEQNRIHLASTSYEPNYQMKWNFADRSVLMDATFLLLTHCEVQYPGDFDRITGLIKEFVPLFFGLDNEAFQKRMQEVFQPSPPNELADGDAPVGDDATASRGRRVNGKKADLLRDVLERGRKSARIEKEGSLASGSRATTPDATLMADEEMTDVPETAGAETKGRSWISQSVDGNVSKQQDIKPNEPYKRNVFNLYANLPIYCFFRLFVILYERLLNMKNNEMEVHETVRRAKMHKPAIDLRMIDRHPDTFFSDTSPNANYYNQILGMLELAVKRDENVTMAQIEETLRRFYLTNGWMLYSFEKLVSSLARFGIVLLTNESRDRSSDILQLFLKDRRKESTTHQDELSYRKQVEKYAQRDRDVDIYRISYNPITSVCTARILKRNQSTFQIPAQGVNADPTTLTYTDGVETLKQRWNYYVAAYSSIDPTEGVPQDRLSPSFLPRSLRKAVKTATDAAAAAAVPTTASDDAENGDAVGATATEGGTIKSAAQARADQLVKYENLRLRISMSYYKIQWTEAPESPSKSKMVEPPVEEWWVAIAAPEDRKKPGNARDKSAEGGAEGESAESAGDDAAAEKSSDGGKKTRAHEGEHQHEPQDGLARFVEKFVMNNKWMAGMSRDAVDAVNKEYRDWVDHGSGGASKDTAGAGVSKDAAVTSAPKDAAADAAAAVGDEEPVDEDVIMAG